MFKQPLIPSEIFLLRKELFGLLERVVDRGELAIQVGAQAVDHSDDRKRDIRRASAMGSL
jgi:hypothetical protein